MRKFLISCIVAIAGSAIATAGYVQPAEGATSFRMDIDGVDCNFCVLDPGLKTVEIACTGSYEALESFTYPTEVTYENETYSVVQISGIVASKKTVIPASIVAAMINGGVADTLVFENGANPIDLFLQAEGSKMAVSDLFLNRSVVADSVPAYNGSFRGFFAPDREVNVSISENVDSIIGPLFKNINIANVEIGNWSKWYNQTKVDCIYAVPYYSQKHYERYNGQDVSFTSQPVMMVAGMKVTTVEIPADATKIPDFKNAGMKYEGQVYLPSTLKKIGAYAFVGQQNLFGVNFPESLTEIGDFAFQNCNGLTFESFPESLKSIGANAFDGCALQQTIILPEGLENLGAAAFANMPELRKAILFCAIDSVPAYICSQAGKLETLFLPQNISSIGEYAFCSTKNLQEVILPEGLETIGECAFNNGGLTKIKFPSTLKAIGNNAFGWCKLRSVEFSEGLIEIGALSFPGNPITTLNLPSTLKTIGDGAFMNCTSLNTAVIPNSVTEFSRIYGGVFGVFGNTNIGNLVIGDGLTEIWAGTSDATLGTPSMLTVGKNVKSIDKVAINFNSKSGSVKVIRMMCSTPPTLSEAFDITEQQYENITFLVPDGAKTAYSSNPRWSKFQIVEESESDVTVYVNGSPISEQVRLQSGLMPSKITKLTVTGTLSDDDWRLLRENFVSLIYLDLSGITNTTIPNQALNGMSQLIDLKLPDKITSIGANVFSGNALMDVPYIPETVETIGASAFSGCQMLSISTLPRDLKSLGNYAFQNCKSLRSITASENLDTLSRFATFEACTALESVDLSKTKLTTLPSMAFSGCTSLETVLLPETLKAINYNCFNSTAIETIELPATVSVIQGSAFSSSNLRSITIPAGVSKIDDSTFSNCANLVSVNLPASLTSIGWNVFSDADKMTGLSCAAVEAPEAGTAALEGLSIYRCSLSIPQQSYTKYLNAPQWGRMANLVNSIVVEIPEDFHVTSIDEAEYQEIVQEAQWNELAQESAEPENILPATAKIRRKAREELVSGANFSGLFNGARLATPTTDKGTRIFINLEEGQELTSVKYNDEELISKVENNSVVLPGRANGTLTISGKSSAEPENPEDPDNSGIEKVEAINGDCVAYDVMGREVFCGDFSQLKAHVAPGLYIVKAGGKTVKIFVD